MSTKEELIEQREKILKEYQGVQLKLSRVNKQIRKIETAEDEERYASITLNNVTPEDWEFILRHNHRETEFHYKKSTILFTSMGLWTSGFWEETEQFSFAIYSYHIDTEEKIQKWVKEFKKILPHLNPIKSRYAKDGEYVTVILEDSALLEIKEDGTARITKRYQTNDSWGDLVELLKTWYNLGSWRSDEELS